MTTRTTLNTLLLLAAFSLSACGSGETENKPKAPEPKLFEQSRNTLDQAKSVEAIQLQQAEEQRKKIEELSQ